MPGAVAVKRKVAKSPGRTGSKGRSILLTPHRSVSCGLCDPRWWGVPFEVQGFVPEFRTVMLAAKDCPAVTVPGTSMAMQIALFTRGRGEGVGVGVGAGVGVGVGVSVGRGVGVGVG